MEVTRAGQQRDQIQAADIAEPTLEKKKCALIAFFLGFWAVRAQACTCTDGVCWRRDAADASMGEDG